MCRLAGLVALLLVAAPAAPPAVADDRDGPLPRIEQVGPTSPAPDDGALEISPAVSEVVVAPDRRVEVRHVVANGLEQPLHLDVEVVAGDLGADGPGVAARPVGSTDPVRLVAPVEQLRLPPSHGAALISTAEADAGRARLLALRATAPDGTAAVAYVVVSADDRPASPELDLRLGDDGRATVTARADRPAVLDVRLRARSWAGSTHDRTASQLVVGERARTLPLDAPPARLPGPVSAVAVAVGDDGRVVARGERFVTPTAPWLLAPALLVLLVAAALVVRRRRHGPATADR